MNVLLNIKHFYTFKFVWHSVLQMILCIKGEVYFKISEGSLFGKVWTEVLQQLKIFGIRVVSTII